MTLMTLEKSTLYDISNVVAVTLTDIDPTYRHEDQRAHRLLHLRTTTGVTLHVHMYAVDAAALLVELDADRFDREHSEEGAS